MLARIVIEPVHAEGVLAEPYAGQLVQQNLVVRQVDVMPADRLVQAQRQPADARRRERELMGLPEQRRNFR
jgi:hypothetical protein